MAAAVQFKYSIYPANQVSGVNRAVAQMALRQAAEWSHIRLPALQWFRSARVGEKVKIEYPQMLLGFTQSGAWTVYVSTSLDPRQIYKTTCHEIHHLRSGKPGELEELKAEIWAEMLTQMNFDQKYSWK